MRASEWFITTLKESPNDAEIASHQLMLRSGMIRKLASGLYTWLPLGLKVLRRIEAIIREEMNRTGAMELLMTSIQPAELWQETGRWETFGGQLLTMKDNSKRAYCFGPTHEEVITDLMRDLLHTYKQLPVNVYQIQTKFRDEIRPRFGVMRAREFIMKDAYSFHLSDDSLKTTYDKMYKAYERILNRMGLKFRAVEADTGAIGGAVSHEFQVLADAGEDLVFYSDQSSYAANIEKATSFPSPKNTLSFEEPLTLVETPDQKTIPEVASFLNTTEDKLVKTLIVEGETTPLVALVLRGDDTLNELKAEKHPWVKSPLRLADHDLVLKTLHAPIGSIGPIGLTLPVLVDHEALAMPSFMCGANKEGHHYIQANFCRDLPEATAYDLRNVKVGDTSPDGLGTLQMCRGIEVGHIFQLGKKYAQAMKAEVTNETGQLQTLTMGCYGMGVSRLVAAAIEQHHDDKGIIWTDALAPFKLSIIPINGHRSPAVKEAAEALYDKLTLQGIEVLLDDRQERPGVLFADHDLIGIPHRFVISDRLLASDAIEYKSRREEASIELSLDTLPDFIKNNLS